MRAAMHLSLKVHGYNLEDGDTEEDAITYAENIALEICEYLKSIGILLYNMFSFKFLFYINYRLK